MQRGAVHVARVDAQSAQVTISGDGYDRTTVTVTRNPNEPTLPFRFECRCFETFGKHNRWCAHKYAAALALAQYGEQGTVGNWQGHLTWLLSACAPTRSPAPPPVNISAQAVAPTFLLIFSLQRQAGAQWRLIPLVTPVSRVPADALDDTERLAKAIRKLEARLDLLPLPKNALLARLARPPRRHIKRRWSRCSLTPRSPPSMASPLTRYTTCCHC